MELEEALSQLDARSAVALERLVRDAVTLARSARPVSTSGCDAKGWPTGYFETTAGSFAQEPLDFPNDPPPGPTPVW